MHGDIEVVMDHEVNGLDGCEIIGKRKGRCDRQRESARIQILASRKKANDQKEVCMAKNADDQAGVGL